MARILVPALMLVLTSGTPGRDVLEELLTERGLRAAYDSVRADPPTEAELATQASRWQAEGRARGAILLLTLGTMLHPGSSSLLRLARAYEENGQHLWARSCYAAAAEFDPTAGADVKRLPGVGDIWKPRGTPKSSKGSRREKHVLRILDVAEDLVVADVGCGSGWLSVAVAEAIGEGGKLYAVEIGKSRVEAMRKRGIPNIEAVLSKSDDVSLPPDHIDLIFLHDVASHVTKKSRPRFYASVARSLRPGGRLVIFGAHGKTQQYLDELRGFGFVPEPGEDLSGLSGKELDDRYWAGIRFTYRPTATF